MDTAQCMPSDLEVLPGDINGTRRGYCGRGASRGALQAVKRERGIVGSSASQILLFVGEKPWLRGSGMLNPSTVPIANAAYASGATANVFHGLLVEFDALMQVLDYDASHRLLPRSLVKKG